MILLTVFDKKDKRIIARHLIVMNFNICNNINQVINDTGVFESYMTSDFRVLPDIVDLYVRVLMNIDCSENIVAKRIMSC